MPLKKSTTKKTVVKKTETTKKAPVKKRDPKLVNLIETLNKKFGDNAVSLGVPRNADGSVRTVPRIPTGSIALDVALGGGIPVGRYTEISGALATTKSTQTLHIIANAQRMGLTVALADAEATLDDPYMASCGVDVDELVYFRPDGFEEATEIMLTLQRSGTVQLGVIDSWAALSPIKEQDSSMDDSTQMGIVPRLMGEYFRKYQMANNRLEREGKQPFTVIGVNQLREKIGSYGDPEYTPGGRAKGFTASVDIRFRRGDWIKQGKGQDAEIVGQVVKFKIEKNKLFRRMQSGEFDFYYSENNAGVTPNFNDNEKSIIILGVQWGVIEKAGSWFKYDDKKYQGIEPLVKALRADRELYDKMYKEVFDLVTQRLRVST